MAGKKRENRAERRSARIGLLKARAAESISQSSDPEYLKNFLSNAGSSSRVSLKRDLK